MKIYLVGGAVRDQQLQIDYHERDWLVTGATVEKMLDKGFIQIDADFPVFKHPQTGDEYALARTEKKQGKGYKGFVTEAGPGVTLEQDLARRDLTINAIAMDEDGNLIDPFHGLDDIRDGKLRHITSAFTEDPVRLLRTARFAAVLGQYGFSVSHETFKLLKEMSVQDELQTIRPERLMKEMNKALAADQCWKFFKVLGKCGALNVLLPGINVWVNGQQMVHGHDSVSILALQRAVRLTDDVAVRFMVVMYNAIVNHGYILQDYLPLDNKVLQLQKALSAHAEILLESNDAAELLNALEGCGVLKQGMLFKQVMLILQSVFPAQAKRIYDLQQLAAQLSAVSSEQYIQQGFSGKQLGQQIQHQRNQIIIDWLSAR